MKNNCFIRTILFLFTIIMFASTSSAKITSTYSINSTTIQELDEWIDKDTIIFVELDEVLVMPVSKMFYYNDNPYRLFIQNLLDLSRENSKYLRPLVKWYQSRKVRLVEDGWQEFINNLKARNVTVYGFCSTPIQLQNIEAFRLSEIEKLGIKFTSNVNGKEVLEINKQDGWKSSFFHGIIFTGPFSTSQTINDFIKVSNISPKKIIVFDKIKDDVQIMEQALHRFRIEYYNILYLAAREFKDKPNPNVIALQQRTLIQDGRWLEDDEAENILNSALSRK